MRKLVSVGCLLASLNVGLCEGPQAIAVSMCTINQSPKLYNGKMVRVRGTVARAEGLALYVDSKECKTAIALAFPDEEPQIRAPFHLIRDDDFRKFQSYLDAPAANQPKLPPGWGGWGTAHRYCDIQVTVIGKFQAVSEEKALRGRGFGNAGASPFQLTVQSVIDPEAKECASSSPAAK